VWEKNGILQKYGLKSLFQMNGKNVVCSYKVETVNKLEEMNEKSWPFTEG